MASAVREAALFSAGSLRYLRLRLWQQHRAEMVGFNAQRPVRLGVVILVRDMRRQLDDLAFREQPLQVREEGVWNVDRRCVHAVRVCQRDALPLRQVAGCRHAECSLNLLARETGFAANNGIDVHSEKATVTDRYADADHLDQVPADGPPSGAKDHVGQERSEHRARGMRLNLRWIQRAAES